MNNTSLKISVAIIDDSTVIRRILQRILETDPNIEIVATGDTGVRAIEIARQHKPHAMLLDVEMPEKDGLTALPEILQNSEQTKIIMCSSLTAKGADTTMKAMANGAVECLVKPGSHEDTGPDSLFAKNLKNLIKSLTRHNITSQQPSIHSATKVLPQAPTGSAAPAEQYKLNTNPPFIGKPDIIAIGSSTGGPQALFNVIKAIGSPSVPIVITQHMPATFTKILASHITQHTGVETHEGEEGMIVERGKAYVAPGGKHMMFSKEGLHLKIKLNDGPPENFCKPSVDPMIRSLMSIYNKKILCVILTGMGSDGLPSSKELAEIGGRIIAQDKATSVVWGMPGAVATAGICHEILPLDQIGSTIKRIVS
ncbi:MAG: chemotaxis-specific protein-glutamate methyltransferase CheB [Alphaproteobacteria bacterium]|nr:chemotaxis-specific protein-glutamate methyltransferase CheB [Alphaproteobacteria bacterium]